MAGTEALTAAGYGLLDPHLGISIADNLGLASRATPYYELFVRTRSPAGAVAG